jgi:hypothetical protein
MRVEDRAALRSAVEAYDQLVRDGRALTDHAVRRRSELLATMRQLTGADSDKSGLKRARKLLLGYSKSRPSRQQRAKGMSDLVPKRATPKAFDAVRITQIVPTAVESSRDRH